jgi:hypothetical protein
MKLLLLLKAIHHLRACKELAKTLREEFHMSEAKIREALAGLNMDVDAALARIQELAGKLTDPDVTDAESDEIAGEISAVSGRIRTALGTSGSGSGSGDTGSV